MENGSVIYQLTDAQLSRIVKSGVTETLEAFGFVLDEAKAKFTADTKTEYRPLSYWLNKLGVNRSTLWRWQKEGRITPRYVGKKIFFCQADFDEMFDNQKKSKYGGGTNPTRDMPN